jgi:HK97 gp10 family phage protein
MKLVIEGLDEFKKGLGEATAQFDNTMKSALRESAELVQQEARRNIDENGTTFEGNLKQSVGIGTVTKSEANVVVGQAYGAAVEYGSRPHWPPIEPMEKWGRIKLGQPGLGFLIARKISRVGTKEKPYLRPALENNISNITSIISSAVEYLLGKAK